MGRYRKIDVRIWNDAKFRTFSDDGKLLFMMLMTHPNQTMLGAMRAGRASLAEDLGWPFERLSKALDEAIEKGMAKHDSKASFLWLPNFLKYNRPESPNVVKAWAEVYELLPECELKPFVWQGCEGFIEGMGEAFRKAFRSLAKEYGESGAGTGAGTGIKTGGALRTPAPLISEVPETQNEPEDTHADEIADAENNHGQDDDPMVCARAMFEALAIPAPAATIKLAASAIRLKAGQLATSPRKAMLLIQRRAELDQAQGATINRFWFEDRGYEKAVDGAQEKPAKKPDCTICENRRMVVREVGGRRMALQCECITGRKAEVKPEDTAEKAPDGVDTELGARIWTGMNKALKSELGSQSYETWIKPIKPLGALNGELYLQIPSPDFANVGDRYDIGRFLPAGVETFHLLSAGAA